MRNKKSLKNTSILHHMGWDGNGHTKPIPCRTLVHAIFGVPPSKRPVGYFVTTTSLTSSEVLERHALGGAETDESAKVFSVKVDELKEYLESVSEMCLNGVLAICTFLYSDGKLSESELLEMVENKLKL